MKFTRATGLLLALTIAAWGCEGEKAHGPAHGASAAAPEPAPPTPDTTPIEALRTPAGLVLKLDQPTAPPAATPTPAP